MSTWQFVEDIEVGDMEYGSGYPGGTCHITVCCSDSLMAELKI